MTNIETEEKKMPEGTDEELKQQQGGPSAEFGVESVVPPWLERERARLREKYELENRQAGERMKSRAERRQAEGREDTLMRLRLNRTNRERPIREWEARDAATREQTTGLWTPTPEEPQPSKPSLLRRLLERVRKVLLGNREADIQKDEVRDETRKLRGSAGFLRGLAASAFKGIGRMSTNIGDRLGPKPDTSNRPARGTPAPGPGLNSLK